MIDLRTEIRTQIEARLAHVELTEGVQDGIDAITDYVLPVFEAATDVANAVEAIGPNQELQPACAAIQPGDEGHPMAAHCGRDAGHDGPHGWDRQK